MRYEPKHLEFAVCKKGSNKAFLRACLCEVGHLVMGHLKYELKLKLKLKLGSARQNQNLYAFIGVQTCLSLNKIDITRTHGPL